MGFDSIYMKNKLKVGWQQVERELLNEEEACGRSCGNIFMMDIDSTKVYIRQ